MSSCAFPHWVSLEWDPDLKATVSRTTLFFESLAHQNPPRVTFLMSQPTAESDFVVLWVWGVYLFIPSFVCYETRSHVARVGLELSMCPRMSLNSCFHLV